MAAVAEPAEPLADEPAQRGHVLGWPQILDGQLQEFGLGVPVARDGGVIHREDAVRLFVVDPHRLGVGVEQLLVARRDLRQARGGAAALDRPGHLVGHELQDAELGLPVAHALGVGLHHQDADDLITHAQGDAHPVQRRGADQLHFAASLEIGVHVRRREQGASGPQHVLGEPFAEPLGRILGVVFVHEIGEGDEPLGRLVQRDIEVCGRDQLADDLMNGAVQLVEVADGARRLRDAVGRGLHLLRPLAIGDVSLRAPDAHEPPAFHNPNEIIEEGLRPAVAVALKGLGLGLPVPTGDERPEVCRIAGLGGEQEVGDARPDKCFRGRSAVDAGHRFVALGEMGVLEDPRHLLIGGEVHGDRLVELDAPDRLP